MRKEADAPPVRGARSNARSVVARAVTRLAVVSQAARLQPTQLHTPTEYRIAPTSTASAIDPTMPSHSL